MLIETLKMHVAIIIRYNFNTTFIRKDMQYRPLCNPSAFIIILLFVHPVLTFSSISAT